MAERGPVAVVRNLHAGFFAKATESEDGAAFEPYVTVLGRERCLPQNGTPFETERVQVGTVRDGKASRFRGFHESAAPVAARR